MRPNPSPLARNGGYTLYEVLGYSLLLLVILNFSASILIGSKRLHALGTLALDRNSALDEVAQDFRKAVHRATGVADAVPGIAPTPGGIALISTSTGGAPRYSLWRSEASGRFYRDEFELGPQHRPLLVYRKVYPPDLKVIGYTLAAHPDSPRLITLELEIDNEGTRRTVPGSNRFIAALGQP